MRQPVSFYDWAFPNKQRKEWALKAMRCALQNKPEIAKKYIEKLNVI